MINKLNKYYRIVYRKALWQMPADKREVYLTFDDGPHPEITPYVLDVLNKHQVKATFFCIGKNIKQYPEVFKKIINDGHSVGNHTYNHLNGLKHSNEKYFKDYQDCQQIYPFKYFRPPYGKMHFSQMRYLSKKTKVVMWSILTKDYDAGVDSDYCFKSIKANIKPGSIIVFHDSEKAFNNLKASLEKSILYLKENKFNFKSLPQ